MGRLRLGEVEPGAVADELTAWVAPEQPTPSEVVVEPVVTPARQPWPVLPPVPDREVSSLLDSDSQDRLSQDVADLDWPRLIAHWPVGADGAPMLKTGVLLAAYGPPTSRRQPCLMVRGPNTKRDLKLAWSGQPGGFSITVTDEFADNQPDNWVARPWWWADTPEPAEPPLVSQCRKLLADGQFSQACQAAGVEVGGLLRQAAAGSTLLRSPSAYLRDFNPKWTPVLHATLARLAPWLLADGLARLEARLAASNKKRPRRGTWSRRLVDFPGQTQQCKCETDP